MTTTEADADICTCDDSTHTGDGTAAGTGCVAPVSTVDQCASNGGQGPCHADATCLDSQMTTTEADADICTCDDSTHTGDGTAAGTGCVAPAPTDICDMASFNAGTVTCATVGESCLQQSPNSTSGVARDRYACFAVTAPIRNMCEMANPNVNPLGGVLRYISASGAADRLSCVFPPEKIDGSLVRQCEFSSIDGLTGSICGQVFESARSAMCGASRYVFEGAFSDGTDGDTLVGRVTGCNPPLADQCAPNGGRGPCHADATCQDNQAATAETAAALCTCNDLNHVGDGTAAGTGCISSGSGNSSLTGGGGESDRRHRRTHIAMGAGLAAAVGLVFAEIYYGGLGSSFRVHPLASYENINGLSSARFGTRLEYRRNEWSLWWSVDAFRLEEMAANSRLSWGGEWREGRARLAAVASAENGELDVHLDAAAEWELHGWIFRPAWRWGAEALDGNEWIVRSNADFAAEWSRLGWSVRPSLGATNLQKGGEDVFMRFQIERVFGLSPSREN